MIQKRWLACSYKCSIEMSSGHDHSSTLSSDSVKVSFNSTDAESIKKGSSWSKKKFKKHLNQISAREEGHVVDYIVRKDDDDPSIVDAHEITAGPNGLIYFSQQLHDRIGYLNTAGKVKFLDMPEGSRPHGIEFDKNGRLFISLEYQDKLAEIDPIDGTILQEFDVSFDDPSVEGVVGPHGLDVDDKGRLWYAGKSSDTLGYYDTKNDEHKSFSLTTRSNFAPNFTNGIDFNGGAAGPIYIKVDRSGTPWFVNLATNEIGKIDEDENIVLYEITGFNMNNNSRPINIFEGPNGFIWTTVEGDNSTDSSENPVREGGIAQFDPVSEEFINSYTQTRDKGAGGSTGHTANSIWFQYQEQALVELNIDEDGRRYQTTYDLPDIGQRVMHRITKGPDGNMWFTSLKEDAIGVLSTKTQAIPVFSFQDQKKNQQYLSALPDELTKLQSKPQRYKDQEALFLSSTKNAQSKATRRFTDEVTGATIWTIDSEEISVMKKSDNFTFEGLDFRVYPEANSAEDLVAVFEVTDKDSGVRTYTTDESALETESCCTDPAIVWYAHPPTL